MRRTYLIAAAAPALFAPLLAHAAPALTAETALESRAADVVAVIQGSRPPAEVFSEAFLAAIPAEQFAAISADFAKQGGKITGAEPVTVVAPGAARFTIHFERADAVAVIQIEPATPFKVIGFRVTDFVPTGDTPARIAADFALLPGASGFALARLGDATPAMLAGHNPDSQLAIGSALKLYVLSALVDDIAARRRKWNDVVPLGARSLPSGMMQDWPAKSPVTLHTLATLMISISDNTATDTLIRLVGRDAVAKAMRSSGHSDPSRTRPFLTTIEAFGLKGGSDERIAQYNAADDAGQARLLGEWADTLTAQRVGAEGTLHAEPRAIDSIEWFASPADVVRVLDRLRRQNDPAALAILGVSPGMSAASRSAWDYAGFKGGSETGVISLNWLLRDKAGQWFALTGSWNDPEKAVDNAKFQQLMARLDKFAR